MPPRIHLSRPEATDVTLVMPAFVPGSPEGDFGPSLAVKTVSVYPQNAKKGLPNTLGGVLVFDPETGESLAYLDAASLTTIRTGAGSAVATDALALPSVNTAAMLGCGGQAYSQTEGICAVRRIENLRLFDRNPERAEALRDRLLDQAGFPACITVAKSAAEAVRNALIICTATTSEAPLFEAGEVMPGCHINAVGSFRPTMQEIPIEIIGSARVYVDHLESALHEAGDLVKPIKAGVITPGHIVGELGELLAGKVLGRTNDQQITLFKAVGMATLDAVCGALVVRRVVELGIGDANK